MRDGRTRKLTGAAAVDPSFEDFQRRCRASLVIVSGAAAGTDHIIEAPVTTLGRGPGVDLACDDDTMSREHAAVEFTGGGLRVRDLGSMNGMRVNDRETRVAEIHSGDRIALGSSVVQLVVEERKREPRTWVVSEDGD